MKTLKTFSIAGALLLCCAVYSGTASGQAVQKQYVADFGAAFTQATVTKARTGMLGLDLSVGKMLTNGLSVGLAIGYDVASFQKNEGIYARIAIAPVLAKAKYYFTIAPAMQLHAIVAGGAYQTIPHLGTDPIGGISKAGLHPGGSIGVGFDYWRFGRQGLGAEFEYNFFDSGTEDLFSYFALRLNYSIIKM
ncbi:MAG: hypothetical protein WC674_06980 [Candidatus Krumholzibacteriia bacterium]